MTIDDPLEPLKPVYNTQRPPWRGYFTGKDYDGRKNWWAELGYTDLYTPQNKLCTHLYTIREKDPTWFDGPIEEGKSVAGFRGRDTRYNTDPEFKVDKVGNLYDYKNYLMKSSTQYKNIAENYNLSPEHPGIDVAPTLARLEYTPYRNLGVGSVISRCASQYGPRFFDKPMNEGCFEKGLALAKYSIPYSVLMGVMDYQMEKTPGPKFIKLKDLGGRIVRNMPLPAALSFGYGISICTSATIRNRDDIYNYLYSAAFTGVLTATLKDNIPLGITFTITLSFLGTIFHYARISKHGLGGPQYNPMFSTPFWFGPLLYKGLDFGHAEVPTDTY